MTLAGAKKVRTDGKSEDGREVYVIITVTLFLSHCIVIAFYLTTIAQSVIVLAIKPY